MFAGYADSQRKSNSNFPRLDEPRRFQLQMRAASTRNDSATKSNGTKRRRTISVPCHSIAPNVATVEPKSVSNLYYFSHNTSTAPTPSWIPCKHQPRSPFPHHCHTAGPVAAKDVDFSVGGRSKTKAAAARGWDRALRGQNSPSSSSWVVAEKITEVSDCDRQDSVQNDMQKTSTSA